MPGLKLTDRDGTIAVEGTHFSVVFSKNEGTIASWTANGQELICAGPREHYYRAPTDFDLLMGNPPAIIHQWRAAGLDRLERQVLAFHVEQLSPQIVEVRVRAWLAAPGMTDGIQSEITYRVYGSGEMVLENQVLVSDRLPHLPRIGLEVRLPGSLDQMAWFGRGPHENYVDRKLGAAVGLYRSSVAEQFTPYVYPSECGGKEDTRWLALTDRRRAGA